MWPLTKANQERFIQEFTVTVAQSWLNISHITSLFSENLTTFRFILNSYILAIIFHELELGKVARKDLLALASAFPKPDEKHRIADILVDKGELWDFPETIRALTGMGEFPDDCKNLELSAKFLIMGVYFRRFAEFESACESAKQRSSHDQLDPMTVFTCAGFLLANRTFSDDLMSATNVSSYAASTMDRISIFREYSLNLYQNVAQISRKYV